MEDVETFVRAGEGALSTNASNTERIGTRAYLKRKREEEVTKVAKKTKMASAQNGSNVKHELTSTRTQRGHQYEQPREFIKETTAVRQLFTGKVYSKITCLKCDKASETEETFTEISVHIREGCSLLWSLEQFVLQEMHVLMILNPNTLGLKAKTNTLVKIAHNLMMRQKT